MEMIEIDPKLFVTCRLCLDNLGVYQIVPSVQEQIKFCYDIEVDPFDRLPQLICKSCESILSKYFEIKNTYVNKQKTLRETLKIKAVTPISVQKPEPEPEQDTVTSTQQFTSEEKNIKESDEVTIDHAIPNKSLDTETSEIIHNKTSITKAHNKGKSNKRIKRPLADSWETEYDKWFICRLCNKSCKTRSGVVKHISTHTSLLHKYRQFIDKDFSVRLKKADNRPNLCNSEQIVVHNMDKFISSEEKYYYCLYKQKRIFDISNNEVNSLIETMSVPKTDKSPVSNDSEQFFKRNKFKRIRLISESSNETVVLENNINKDSSNLGAQTISEVNTLVNENECINIDDSSDSVSCKSVTNTLSADKNLNKKSLKALKQMDCKIIQNIISVCYKKYVNKFERCESEDTTKNCTNKIDSSLKHKVLSFGRKIINNSEINCIGILRYLERQNIEVVWVPRLFSRSIKKLDHVQIMVKFKSPEESDSRDVGWTVLQDLRNPVGCNTIDLSEVSCADDQILKENLDAPPSVDMPVVNEENSEEKNDPAISEQATLCLTNANSDKDLMLKKLLNANPVLNPKQLRKKPNTLEVQNTHISKKTKDLEKPLENVALSVSPNEKVVETSDNVVHMPIITSTISLAPVTTTDDGMEQDKNENVGIYFNNMTTSNIDSNSSTNYSDETQSVNQSQASVKNPQWIKVKPVTELMSDRALNSMNQQNVCIQHESNIDMTQSRNINLPYQNSSNIVCMTNVAVPQGHNVDDKAPRPSGMLSLQENNILAQQMTSEREYVLMDTVDLPHRKTESPFNYFKMLLQIHNIILLDAHETIPVDAHSLIKFKLLFQQETNVPIVLCLSLYCAIHANSPARFCIKVKDERHKDINIIRLSANWQWEILKVYGGDVVTKMMQNAQKIGHIFHEYAKIFVCLLRGIKFQKLT